MQLPSEKFVKEYETISSGAVPSAQSYIDVTVDFNKYDKLILEILPTDTTTEGTSCIMELDSSGEPINNYINFCNIAIGASSGTTYQVIGFAWKYSSTIFRIFTNNMTGWTNRNYVLKGILKK